MKKLLIFTLVALLAAGGIGYLVTSGGSNGSSSDAGSSGLEPADGQGLEGVPAGPAEKVLGDTTDSWSAAYDESQAASRSAGGDVVTEQAAPGLAAPETSLSIDSLAAPSGGVGPKVIKNAYLTMEVAKDGFEDAWDDAVMIAQRYGGFVVSSSSSGDKSRSGDLLIRVPSRSFEQAMHDLQGLGDVEDQSVNGQEVTDQFIDLSARLRSWEAQQRVLLRLMDKANTIGETMTVQREIQQVQVQIEQIKGQLRMLRDQTSYGTIQLAMHEPGAVITKPDPQPVETPSLATAWARAWAGFLSVVALVIVGLGYVIPLGALALLVWLGVRRFGSRPEAVTTG